MSIVIFFDRGPLVPFASLRRSHILPCLAPIMTPDERVRTTAVASAVALAVSVIPLLPAATSGREHGLKFLLGLAGGASAYKAIAALVEWVILAWRPLKKRFFGKYWLEGTWIGAYRGSDGSWRRVVEHVRQDLVATTLDGRAQSGGTPLRNWRSVAANLDTTNNAFAYSYQTRVVGRGGDRRGLGDYTIGYAAGFPDRLIGHSTDVEDGVSARVAEVRISDNPDFAVEANPQVVDAGFERAKALCES